MERGEAEQHGRIPHSNFSGTLEIGESPTKITGKETRIREYIIIPEGVVVPDDLRFEQPDRLSIAPAT